MTYFKYSSLLASLAFLGLAVLAFIQLKLNPGLLLLLTALTLFLSALSDLSGLMLKDRPDRHWLELLCPLASLLAGTSLFLVPLKNQTALLLTVIAIWLVVLAGLDWLLAKYLPPHQSDSPFWRRGRAVLSGGLGFSLLLYPIFPKEWTVLLLVVAFTGKGLLAALQFYKLNRLF